MPVRLIAALLAGHLCLAEALAQTNTADLPSVSIQVLSNAAEYGSAPGAFAVTRTGLFDQGLDVEYQITGTASNAVDYQRLSGRVTIPAGEASAQITVIPFDDRNQEPPETVVLTLVPRNRPFSLVLLPDTQYYTAGYSGGLPEMFTAQTRWIAAKKNEQNIAFVLHEGDVTDGNTYLEWQRARTSLNLLDGVVPYAVAVGNHDGLNGSVSQTSLFNQFVSAANYLGQPGFGGVFESNRMDNCYHLFSAGGVDWLILVLEFGPRNEVLAWANQVVANYPDRKVILLTHTHVYADNTLHGSSPNHLWKPTSYGRANNGTDVWNKLLRLHPNTAFAFNGHVLLSGTGRLVGTNDYGNQVFQILADYQTRSDGGGGFLRLVQFFPEQDSMSVKTYSPYLDSWLQDSENQFTYTNLGVFAGASPGYLVDPSQGSASLIITNDDLSLYPPDLVSGSYLGMPPVFTLTFDVPLDPNSAQALTNYSLSDGTRLVAAQLSADQTAVFLSAESNLVEGVGYELAANNLRGLASGIAMTNATYWPFTYHSLIMVDDFSAGNVAAYTIVDEGAFSGPSAWSEAGGRLVQWSNIFGPDSSALDHRKGTFAVWNALAALNWTNYAVSVSFRNADDDGLGLLFRYQDRSNYYKVELDSQRSFRRLFKMVEGVETTLAAETNGYLPGQDYQLRVTVTNSTIRVRLNGTLLFGGPVLDSSLAAGTVALYSWGSQGLSFSNLTVTPPAPAPGVAITSPGPAAAFRQFAAIPISISATDTDGTITHVEILDGTNRLAAFSQPPYRMDWAGAAPGDHTIVVQATDNSDMTGTSQVLIHVQPAYVPGTNDDAGLYAPELVSGSYLGIPPVFRLSFNVPLDPISAQALTNYSLSDGTPLVAASLSANLTDVFLTAASNLVEGTDYALVANNLQNLLSGIAMPDAASWPFSYHALIMADDFLAGNLSWYTIVDEGTIDEPSSWMEAGGRLVQGSGICGPDPAALDHRQGTFAVWNAPDALTWTSYTAAVWFNNSDDKGLGLLFRYQNPSNYFKVELDSQQSFRKLFRVLDGVETTLAAETNSYVPGENCQLQVIVVNNVIRVRLNGALLFGGPVLDSSLPAGTVALYSWGSQGLSFSNLTVMPAPPLRSPGVAILSPPPSAAFKQFAAIPISISATDADGMIAQVEILDGTNSLAVLSQPPYYLDWTDAKPGDHTIVVQATDNLDLMGRSQVLIHVEPYPPPAWTRDPQSQVVPAGSGVLLAAQAVSSWPLSYQWYFNGQPIADASHRLFFLNAVQPDNGGSYWVVANDVSACATSQVAVLSVSEAADVVAGGPLGFHRLSLAGVDEMGVPVLSLEADLEGPFTLEASSPSLTNWLPLFDLTNTGSPFYFTDPALAGADPGARFYRTVRMQ